MNWVEGRFKQRDDAAARKRKLDATVEKAWGSLHDACNLAVRAYQSKVQGPTITFSGKDEFSVVMNRYSDQSAAAEEIDSVTVTFNRSGLQIIADRKHPKAMGQTRTFLRIDAGSDGEASLFSEKQHITPEQASQALLDGMFFPEFEKDQ